MTRVCVLLLAVLGLAACAGITEPLGMKDPFAVPQPFEGVDRNDTMLSQAILVPALVVEAPQGMADDVSAMLRDRVVEAARKHDVPAFADPTVRAWVLSGQAATILSGESYERSVISWRVVDDEGRQRAQFPVAFVGTAATLGEEGLRLVAEQTATIIEKGLQRPGTQITDQAVAKKPVAWVGVIKGAPGDGNEALARALSGVLPLKGVRVDVAKEKAEWRVEGLIKVVHGSAGEDVVTLTWRVLDAKGKEAGTITQENAVPRGRLSQSWAEIAAFAAEAAAEGIAQLIQQIGEAKRA